jgi:hypothetical protein
LTRAIAAAVLCLAAFASVTAQSAPSIYQRYAPIDLTGTWVSIVTEDWDVRMLTPKKGDFHSLPLTRAAQDAANRIDMTQVEAAGRACDAYGAPAVMRHPGRVRIAWQDGATIRMETNAGQQTRLLHFTASDARRGDPTLQGFSAAEWQYANGFDPLHLDEVGRARGGARGVRGGAGRGAAPTQPTGGRLKVATTNLTAGFLRKNGVPYSADTTVTEYYNLLAEPTSTEWFVVTTVVHDPVNLAVDYITSTNFRKEPDDSKFTPEPCTLR